MRAIKMALNMAPYGHFWSFSSKVKVPFVGTLKLCQEMPDTMQNKSGHFNHTILRKRWKYGQNIDDFIFFFFLKMDSWVELIPVVYLHPSYGRRIEYQQGILWENFGMAIFDQKGHFGAILAKFSFFDQTTLCWDSRLVSGDAWYYEKQIQIHSFGFLILREKTQPEELELGLAELGNSKS